MLPIGLKFGMDEYWTHLNLCAENSGQLRRIILKFDALKVELRSERMFTVLFFQGVKGTILQHVDIITC